MVDSRLNDALFRLHDFEESEVFKISVLDSLVLDCELLAYLLQVLSTIELLNCSLEAFKPKNERGDVVERSAGGSSPDDDFNTVGSCLMFVVLAAASHSWLDPLSVLTLGTVLAVVFVAFGVSFSTFEGFSSTNLVRNADLLGNTFPAHVNAVSIVEPLEDTVAPNHDKVEVVLHLETLDIRLTHNNIWIAAVTGSLGLNISEGLRD